MTIRTIVGKPRAGSRPPVRVPRRRVRARPGRKAGASAHAGRDRAS
ncbi:hypothetical protein GS506_05270 [Rhodococcus hoagii]|nr:hypothetical protein [Prescottella equi]